MKILTFSGSLRRDSLNKRLCQVAALMAQQETGAEVQYCDLQPLQIPVYDGDIEKSSGLPDGVNQLAAQIQVAEALIISTPEYNGSIAGSFKNTLDWLSRHKPDVLKGKPVLLLAASPGALGGVRTLWHSRQPLEVLGCHVYPDMMGVSKAHENLTPAFELVDEKMQTRLRQLIKDFAAFASRK